MLRARRFPLPLALCAALPGCLPTYEPAAPAVIETRGPARGQGASAEPVAVRPTDPSADSSVFLESEDATRLIDRLADEGPPEQAARLHSCMKVKFDTLGRLLASRGANMKTNAGASILPITSATTATTCNALRLSTSDPKLRAQPARYVYCDARGALGLPQYPARLAEAMVQTTASAAKMHDLFLAAAPEIIAGFGAMADCRWQGQQAQLFTAQNRCDPVGMACLIGYVPGQDLLDLCDQIVTTAEATPAGPGTGVNASAAVDAVTTGKQVAVAALLATAHMCE